jgi:predicted metal-dependent HD superfamily phosphohydrolase
MADLYELRKRFETLCSRTLPAVIPFNSIADHYAAPPRAYHNLDHISQMLGEFDAAKHLAQSPDAVEFAIWYHDAIYNSRSKDNEEQSAQLARADLAEAEAPESLLKEVEALILATRHQQPPVTADEQLLVDCDLAILGQPAAAFDAYEKAIRVEYDWVPDTAFREGRAKVLNSFLARPTIYSLPYFQQRYEAPSRTNVARSIQALSR